MAAAAFVIASLRATEVSIMELLRGGPHALRIFGEMLPPSLDRIGPVLASLLQTFQMAVAGTVIGCALSLPLAVLATRHLSPNAAIYHLVRIMIAVCRTVPDLVWALLFVAIVGLGPFAGVLAIAVDKIGFCGRFFAEAMEEADRRPQEALRALGAAPAAVIAGAVLPTATPGLINATLFALEKATRSSVVLGLVGAGGIGIELQVSMDMFRYDEAATIILAILGLVIAVEQISAWLRRRAL
ncbi:MAG: phosphonate ABC transporter, permease protein PhnE [Rhodospirillales bacterium]